MYNNHISTTSGQPCDTTTSSPSTTDQPSTNQTTSSTSSTSSRVRACARAREAAPELPPIERLHQTRELYESNIGRMTPAIANMIERCLLAGMEPDVVDAAIAKTGWARRPSPNYLAAILRRYSSEDIKTIDDLMQDEARYEAMKEQRRAERAARWYEEDSCTCDELPF